MFFFRLFCCFERRYSCSANVSNKSDKICILPRLCVLDRSRIMLRHDGQKASVGSSPPELPSGSSDLHALQSDLHRCNGLPPVALIVAGRRELSCRMSPSAVMWPDAYGGMRPAVRILPVNLPEGAAGKSGRADCVRVVIAGKSEPAAGLRVFLTALCRFTSSSDSDADDADDASRSQDRRCAQADETHETARVHDVSSQTQQANQRACALFFVLLHDSCSTLFRL